MLLLIKNANVYAPESLGMRDLLIGGGRILAIEEYIAPNSYVQQRWDAQGKILTPGLIDQHMHILGAGGTRGFASMTPEVQLSELIACGTTTVVGLLGTDGSTRSIKSLYAKTKSLEMEGLSAYMLTSYFGIDPVTITHSIQEDMIFIDKVIGCKVAISDIRSSYPSDRELLRHLQQVRVGGQIASKKGILHIHLGILESRMDILFRLVQEHHFPIEHISPTHVGRTEALFEQSLEFAKLGGMIDITTGASQYTKPWKSVMYALKQGIPLDRMTFSSDGNTGLSRFDEAGNRIGFRQAPIDQNLAEVISLIQEGGLSISQAFSLITSNPAKNLGLPNKGRIVPGADADLCCFTDQWELTDVFAKGQHMMADRRIIVKGSFE
ncbi:MAG: beta-aspartyl-peptidase [Bacteroidota bacterium]